MDEDAESSDISAAELAAICNKGQYARSISLALSANTVEDTSLIPCDDSDTDTAQNISDGLAEVKIQEVEAGEDKGLKDDYKERTEDSDDESNQSGDDSSGAVQEIPLPVTSTHRRRNKRQKQNLQRHRAEFLAPFMGDSDSDEEIAAIRRVEGEDRPQRVPTLMELCMQCGISRASSFPPGLRPMMSHYHSKTKLAAQQVRWLGRNLSLLEMQMKWDAVDVVGAHGVKMPQVRRDCRCVWRTDWWSHEEQAYPEFCQWILPVSIQVFNAVDWKIAALAHYIHLMLPHQCIETQSNKATSSKDNQGQNGNRHVQQLKRHLKKRYPKIVKCCFDHAMGYVWWARGRCTLAQEAFRNAMQTYPADKISETLWARHRSMALVEMARLLLTFNRPESCGQFYREAIDLASKNLHPFEVSKLTLQSLALTASAYDQGLMDQHSAIQAAGLWTATSQHAQSMQDIPIRSYSMYDIQREVGNVDAIRAAVESLVHCHAGHLINSVSQDSQMSRSDRNRAWLKEARVYLEKLMVERCAFVGLYLSLILAMLNEGIAAENAYNYCLTSYGVNAGEVARLMSMDDIKPHPWWLFKEWIEARTTTQRKVSSYPLQVLPLVWRRGLGNPSYCHNRSDDVLREQVADIQGMTLDLHLTSKGHLSGAMAQNLPPLRRICLDPYTGQLHFDDSGCDDSPQKWDFIDQRFLHNKRYHGVDDKHRFDCNSAPLQPNLIYSDAESSTYVTLLIPGISNYYQDEADSKINTRKTQIPKPEHIKSIHQEMRPAISAVYQSNGKHVKIDVVELVLQEHKKLVLEKLSGDYDVHILEHVEAVIDYSLKRRYLLSMQIIENCIQDKLSGGSEPPTTHQRHSTREGDYAKYFSFLKTRNQLAPYVSMLVKNILYVGKATVVLFLHLQLFDALVFLDCSSPGSFSQPVVRISSATVQNKDNKVVWRLPGDMSCWLKQNPAAKLLMAYFGSLSQHVQNETFSHNKMCVFDERGNVVSYNAEEIETKSNRQNLRFFSTCHGHKLIGTNNTKTRLTVCDLQTCTEIWLDELPQILEIVVVHNTIYISTMQGPYALDINTVKPLVIVQLKPSRYTSPSNDEGHLLDIVDAPVNTRHFKLFCPHEVKMSSDGAAQYYRAFLAVLNHIFLVQRRKISESHQLDEENAPDVLEVLDIMIPGKATELCYISQQDGFIVSASVFGNDSAPHYKENLYWFDMAGNVIAIHPFIGRGHHGFVPVYLNDLDAEEDVKKDRDLYLYFADGLGALCCIKLDMIK